eukprot:CAMPEP_0184498586 /NCGR_PEP_ID=MMETSP0113_2-20130426/39372_1 /TAXON_ID=91329 /ORGANISM="Norrisiella sphaerica, Strain BC52" /LENGTH=41 /DNA_ID= /DNA_START= /DNA_END= /DNA_ORIENTATION=
MGLRVKVSEALIENRCGLQDASFAEAGVESDPDSEGVFATA